MITLHSIVVELKEDRNKLSTFSYFCGGNLYYTTTFENNLYQFSIPTDNKKVGTTSFDKEIRTALLLRYIRKCLEKDELIKLD